MAFAFMGSSSWNSSSGSPPTLLGKCRRPSLVSGLRQNRILALFSTHVVPGPVLTGLLAASDQGTGTNSAGNVFMLLGVAM
jgi:hypothetical protein